MLFGCKYVIVVRLLVSPYIACRTDSTSYGDSTPSLNVELSTCSQCSSCHALLYDEQIMSGWNGDEANYKTTCPYCSSQLVASLTVITKQVRTQTDGCTSGSESPLLNVNLHIHTYMRIHTCASHA